MPPRDPEDVPVGDEHDGDVIDLRALRGEVPAGADDDVVRLGEIARSLSVDDLTLDEPPPSVWQGIAARTGVAPPDVPPTAGGAGRGTAMSTAPSADAGEAPPAVPPSTGRGAPPEVPPSTGGGGAPPEVPPAPRIGVAPPAGPPPEGAGPAEGSAAPRHLPTGRRPSRRWGLAAAAIVLVLLVVVGAVAAVGGGDGDRGSVVASAELEPLPGEPTGAARPVRADLVDTDGVLKLELSTSDLPAADGYYEVWLIDTNVDGMVSLGPARSDGRYAVPADIDPGQFPIVDVSIEPPDGNPTHSGVSVLRGSLA